MNVRKYIFSYYLYYVVAQNMLLTFEGKQVFK